jgi:hypothetical protein
LLEYVGNDGAGVAQRPAALVGELLALLERDGLSATCWNAVVDDAARVPYRRDRPVAVAARAVVVQLLDIPGKTSPPGLLNMWLVDPGEVA